MFHDVVHIILLYCVSKEDVCSRNTCVYGRFVFNIVVQ